LPLPFGAPAWLMLTLQPATTTAPFLATPAFDAIATVAVPEPTLPPLTEAHTRLEVDDHAQPAAVVTVSVAEVALGETLKDVGDTV